MDALRAAVAEAKRGKDVERYEKAVEALAEAAPNDVQAVLDAAWIAHTSKLVKVETERMELELKGYKNNLIKESIRVSLRSNPICFWLSQVRWVTRILGSSISLWVIS